MPPTVTTDWRADFGIDDRRPPTFFSSKAELDPSVPQAHVLRRAFDLLHLDGVLCSDNSPLIYFKQVKRIVVQEVDALHRQFWNHGGAPVLVLVSPEQVHVYSGLSRPVAATGDLPSLITVIDKMGKALREFLVSVETGEFFHKHSRSFNPVHRVDRDLLDNLKDTRARLEEQSHQRLPTDVLDGLLCRLVFACYLFDREVIGPSYLSTLGIEGAGHLRDILGMRPRTTAKKSLYRLFKGLGESFNGDLFSDDLSAEAELITNDHIDTLDQFFRATAIRTGQQAFWPYDFGVIPIETISAIYERFLKDSEQKKGAFYTPRFLAEVVLDTALEGFTPLLGKRFLDPACGSGIFLVGLFNRMAEEWRHENSTARNERRAKELMRILRSSLFGVDISPTACKIAAFSLYLAYLDQLSPRDIQDLQEQGQALPRLIASARDTSPSNETGNIWCGDFFASDLKVPDTVDLVVGNPPWGSIATQSTPAGRWSSEHDKVLPDKQIAAAFVWKATEHVASTGRVCFVLPHGVLFNHSSTALAYQKAWFQQHAVDRVLNLADFQRFLFEKAGHPAIIVRYRQTPPEGKRHQVEYWAPKTDWTVTQAEVIAVAPQDRTCFTLGELLHDLEGQDAPQLWKQRYWATPRDWRLLDRLALYPRLRERVRQAAETDRSKPWLMAVGFQPFGENDPPSSAKILTLPGTLFIPATSEALDLFLLEQDCSELSTPEIRVRRLIQNTDIFCDPHVLVAEGYTSIAYADFDVAFQHAIRGIHGPTEDRDLLIFLAAYLRSSLARYYLFHTSSNWGVSRQKVHVEEVLRLPMPLPDQLPNRKRCWGIVKKVSRIVVDAANQAKGNLVDRAGIIRKASEAIEPLVEDYFDVLPLETLLIQDTIRMTIPSVRPTRKRLSVPTIMPSTQAQREAYRDRVCEILNGWAKGGSFLVQGWATASESLGVGMMTLEKVSRDEINAEPEEKSRDLLKSLDQLRKAGSRKHSSFDPVRGLMVFDRNQLHIVKPVGQRHWTQTAALNDADEIAGTILMHSRREGK